MAMSRASPLPVSSLFKPVMQDQPPLETQRIERESAGIFNFDAVLHASEVERGCGLFGNIGKVYCFSFFSFFFSDSYVLCACVDDFICSFYRITQTTPWKLSSGYMYPSWMRMSERRRSCLALRRGARRRSTNSVIGGHG